MGVFFRNSRNSRFGAFYSRLGAANSRFGSQREFAGNGLIYLTVFFGEVTENWGKSKNSRLNGKYREFAPPARSLPSFPLCSELVGYGVGFAFEVAATA
jgi:hypothetical protein